MNGSSSFQALSGTRRRTSMALVIAACLLGARGQASADPGAVHSILELTESIPAEQAQVAKMGEESEDLVRRNEQLMRTYRQYADQLERRVKPLAAALKAEGDRHNAAVGRHNEGVRRHNASCAGAPVSQAQYAQCSGEKAAWDRSKARLDLEAVPLKRRAAALQQQARGYTDEMDRLAALIKQNLAATEALKRSIDEKRQHIRRMIEMLTEACRSAKENKDLETLKHCHSVYWDGADPKLRPMGKPRRPLVIVPNQ